jgi:hypothetical protein
MYGVPVSSLFLLSPGVEANNLTVLEPGRTQMAKILFDERWYDEIAPTGMYESVYETMIKRHARHLWPRFHPVHFKANLHAGLDGRVKADFALVERSYLEWWVVEVEMEQHSLESHVLPQTRKLANAAYGDDVAVKLCDACNHLNLAKTKALIQSGQPGVLVVVNKARPDWAKRLAEFGAKVAVFEMFKDGKDGLLFRINGEHPIGRYDSISICHFDPLMRRLLVLETHTCFAAASETLFRIEYEGRSSDWRLVKANEQAWLEPVNGPNPLPDDYTYELIRHGDSRLSFERITKGKS